MRLKTALPWALLLGVIAYVFVQQGWWHNPFSHPESATLSGELTPPSNTNNTPAVGSGPISYAPAVSIAAPAVVNIYTTQKIQISHPFMNDPFFRRFFGGNAPQERMQSSLGSGVIASPEGYVLTNNHVVEHADAIVVALKDGRETKARVIGTDPATDLAVLKIDLNNLPVVHWRSSALQVGDVVLAIGNPFGVGQTVTQGIVSALGRQGLGINAYEDFIQTDAAINPGNSGGALIDVSGNLIGINSAIYSQSGGNMGIGFAIPASLAQNVMQSLIRDGKVVRGWLGVEIQSGNADERGSAAVQNAPAIVAGIMRGGPADKAGLEPGDILKSINNTSIKTAADAVKLIAGLKPGTRTTILVERDKQEIKLVAIIGERPQESRR